MTLEQLRQTIPGAKVVMKLFFTQDSAGTVWKERCYEVHADTGAILAHGWSEEEAVDRAFFLWGPK